MSEFRRWAHTVVWEGLQISATYMAINDGGEYVMHDDYAALHAEAEALRGLTPELPPRQPEGAGLPRYGLRWNGPAQPLSVPMDDGYWTPWHLAEALRAECERLGDALDRQSVITGDYIARCQRLADELAITHRVIDRIGHLCTTPHESKERFIRRVQSVIEWERAAQQEQPQ